MNIAQAEAAFWPTESSTGIWMIVDGARDRRIYSFLVNSYLRTSCLYSGELDPQLEAAAPHLVQLERDDKYTRQLLQRSWGQSWGVFLRCETSMEALRKHLRRLLIVSDPRGRRLLFRYYDPRVLRVYLPTCVPDELRSVFGPIERIWIETADAADLTEYRFDGRELGHKSTFARTRTASSAEST